MIKDEWDTVGDLTTDYVNLNKAKVVENASLLIDFNDTKTLLDVTVKQMVNDFGSRYKTGAI